MTCSAPRKEWNECNAAREGQERGPGSFKAYVVEVPQRCSERRNLQAQRPQHARSAETNGRTGCDHRSGRSFAHLTCGQWLLRSPEIGAAIEQIVERSN